MRKLVFCFLALCFLIPFCCSAAAHQETVTCFVASDLHFSQKNNSSIYPLMSRAEDMMNIIADEVIAAHPTAFILCGDNTNSGRESDAEALAGILKRIHDAGIEVVVVPGNHDFDLSDLNSFEKIYRGLCERDSTDAASLSYSLHFGSLRILAMDDSSFTKGKDGLFSSPTLSWLKQQLTEARQNGEEIVFLSHHNVLPGGENAENSLYMIQCPELRDLLEAYDVRLCLSGHRHSQEILSDGDLYEIVSAMPAISPHLIGMLCYDGERFEYKASPIRFSQYGEPYGLKDFSEWEASAGKSSSIPVEGLASWEKCSKQEQSAVARLYQLFMENYGLGTLSDVRDEICADPSYGLFLELFEETNYGQWMRYLLSNDLLPSNRLELELSIDTKG